MAETAQTTEDQVENQNESVDDSKTQAQDIDLPEAEAAENTGPGGSIDILLDVNVPVTVMIGRAEVSIQKLLQMGVGSVLQLDTSTETPAEIYLKDSKFATGTIVVVDNHFAVRIEQIISASDDTNNGEA